MYHVDYLENDSDDTLNLLFYLGDKRKEEIPLAEIFSDIGLDRMGGDFRETAAGLGYVTSDETELDFHYAIDLVAYLAALVLECRENGSVELSGLSPDIEENCAVTVTATPGECELLRNALADFAASPEAYDFSEMAQEDELSEMAEACGALCRAL